MPAVIYGPKEKASHVFLRVQDFKKVWGKAGETTLITVKVKGDKDREVMIHEAEFDPIRGEPIHADFYVVDQTKTMKVHVPIEFTGTAPAIKELGGVLVKVLHEIEIESMPKDIPHEIKVDLSSLSAFGSHITVGDIIVPTGVTVVSHANETIVLISEPKEEVEETPISIADIEVEKKGKKEEEGEEGKGEEGKEGEGGKGKGKAAAS